MKLYIIWPSWS